MSSYNNQVPTPNKLIKKRTEQKKKIVVSNRKKKLKMGLSKVNGGCQIEKRKKKLQTTKRGVKQQKQKKRLWPTHQYKSRSRFWLGRLLRSRCRRSRCVRRRRSRCRGWSLPCSSPPWVVAGCRCGWFRGRGWFAGVVGRRWLHGSRCVGASRSRVAAVF